MKKTIEVELPNISSFKSFSEDGHSTYCVRLNVIGIDHDIWMTVPGDSEDEACDIAMDSISQMDSGDCSIEEVIEFIKPI